MENLAGQKVTVVGFGISGQAAASLAAALGAQVTVMDHRNKTAFPDDFLQKYPPSVTFHFAGLDEQTLLLSDLVVVSPGVSPDLPELRAVAKKRIAMIGELEFAARNLNLPIIAVTGTNGKTTTTSLIAHALRNAGRKPFVGGNIGIPYATVAREMLSKTLPYDVAVLEVSSYQLELTETFRPRIALILNFALNHQDRYKKFADYIEAKARMFLRMGKGDTLILNGNDPHCRELGDRAHRQGIAVQYFDDGHAGVAQLPGRHNRENLAAATMALQVFGLMPPKINKAFESFAPLPHRLQRVAQIKGIEFFNDSKATTVHATLAALQSFESGVVWIGGGYEQNEDFSPIKAMLPGPVRHAFFVGDSRNRLQHELGGVVKSTVCDSLEMAVQSCLSSGQSGDHVLFSPAAKSFDRYKNYEERGEHFIKVVKEMEGL